MIPAVDEFTFSFLEEFFSFASPLFTRVLGTFTSQTEGSGGHRRSMRVSNYGSK